MGGEREEKQICNYNVECRGTWGAWGSTDTGTCTNPVTKEGPLRFKDFHSRSPEQNRFKAVCEGGCIHIIKVVHDCSGNRMPTNQEMKLVKDICENKETCEFRPAPSFFGHRGCSGTKKTWVHWKCINARRELSS